jgi:hypothetical protein
MRRLAVLTVVAGSLLGLPASATARPVAAAPVHYVKTCSPGYVRAVVGGSVKCLHSGQFCSASSQSAYRRYGFVCKPGSDGRNRLSRR